MQDGEEKEEGQEQLTGALCALAERLLGEADDVEAVAGQCEQLLQQAQQACLHSPEPQQVLSSPVTECCTSEGHHQPSNASCLLHPFADKGEQRQAKVDWLYAHQLPGP